MAASSLHRFITHQIATALRRMLSPRPRPGDALPCLLAEAAMEGVIIHRHGLIREANAAAAALLGYEPGELVGLPLTALVAARDTSLETLHAASAQPREIVGRKKDGSPIPLDILGKTISSPGHTLQALALREITGRKLAEAALRSSEERFRQLAEHIGEVFWLTSASLDQVIYVSPMYAAMWGRSCASLYDSPRSMLDAVHPADHARVAAHLGATGEPSVVEYRIARPDGAARWIGSRAFPIRNQHDVVYRVAVLAQDITERKRVEAALHESAASIRALYDIAASQHLPFQQRVEALLAMGCDRFGLPIGILARIEGDTFHVLAARASDVSIRAGDTFDLGDTYCSITAQQTEPLGITRMGESPWSTHPCYSMFNLESYFGTTVRVRGLTYGTLCFSSREPREQAFTESDKDVLRLMAQWVSGEIERRQSEESLEQQYREAERARGAARAVFDATNDGMVYISASGQLISVNRRVSELFGIPADALVGRSIAELHAVSEQIFADPSAVLARLGDCANEHAQSVADTLMQRAPELRELALFSTPVRSTRQAYLGRLFAFRDVTHERAVDRMKSEFVSLVSHELRTPLTSIKGYVDILLGDEVGPLAGEQREFLGIVKESADHLVAIINDLLDVARLESGHLEIRRAPLDLQSVICGATNLLRPQIVGKRQALAVHVNADLPLVMGDAQRVAQIVTNLLSNAHKYTPSGGSISISAQAIDRGVRVAVQDTGIGLSIDEQAQLFGRFFRAHNRATQEAGGTGLGLAITRSLVELHGGAIDVRSAPGAGAIFSFTLPAAPETTEALDD